MRPAVVMLGLSLAVATLTFAAKPDKDAAAVDPVAIASVLVAEGRFQQAEAVLNEVDTVPKADRVQYHKLRGLIALNLQQWQQAADALDEAVAEGAEPITHVFSAQAKLELGNFQAALDSLEKSGDAGQKLPGYWQLKSTAHNKMGDTDSAYRALLDGREQHSEHQGLLDDQLRFLVELGLTREAIELGQKMLPVLGAKSTTWVGLGDQLRRNGALDEAIGWLEDTRLRFPESVDAKVALASACLEAELPLCCAEMLQEAAAYDNTYASESAECFRRAGVFDRALYLNGTVVDDEVKVRQRLGLLLEQREFAIAASLAPRLSRLGVLEDEQVAYALAYAHFENGSYAQAERLLRSLRDPRLFQQATKLREAMQQDESPRSQP